MRRARLLGAAVVAAGAVAAVAVAAAGFGGAPRTTPPAAATKTAPVTRTTLVKSQPVNGVLGYGTAVPVTGAGQGTVTWLPPLGAVVRRGKAVFRADNRPVPLFYGRLPLFRDLRPGHSGADVRQVERNLKALGYTGFTADGSYTWSTALAVRRWQKANRHPQTGVLSPSSVVVAPGPIRIAARTARPGAPANGPLLSYAGTRRTITIHLDVSLQTLVKRGRKAVVTLPDGGTVDGRVTAIGSVATAAAEEGQPATIDVTVTVKDQKALGRLDQAPVVVDLVAATAENVLAVPVTALLALSGGGYGVQVGGQYVPVRLGLFADGLVEVSGVAEGTLVGVPS
jgi:peptidoglycan hydrolase-like protein with peptidoglycan-binding domain